MGLVAVVAGGVWLWEAALKERTFPKRFGVVEAGSIYRSGQMHPSLVRRTLQTNDIDEVVSLIDTAAADDEDLQADAAEQEACRALGIERRVFPLAGDGTGDIESYAQALASVTEATRAGRRILGHCSAGTQRTGGAVAAYRVLVQGWEPSRACAEMAEYGWDPAQDRAVLEYLNDHMDELAARLVELRVLPAVPNPLPVLTP